MTKSSSVRAGESSSSSRGSLSHKKAGIGDGGRNAGGDGSFKLAWMCSDKDRLSTGGGGGVVGRTTSGSAGVSCLGWKTIGFVVGGDLRFGIADGIGEDGRLDLGRGCSGDLGLLTCRWVWVVGSGVHGRSKTGARSSPALGALSTECLSNTTFSSRKRMRSAYERFNNVIPNSKKLAYF